MTDREHQHDHDGEHGESYGMALGFRILEEAGQLYLAEAEISPYVDEPTELGATLIFHPLEGLNPADETEGADWPSWPVDIDDELTRDASAPIPDQFQAILQQLRGLSEDRLIEYLQEAREGAEG